MNLQGGETGRAGEGETGVAETLGERACALVDSAVSSSVVATGETLVEVPGEELTMWALGGDQAEALGNLWQRVYGVLYHRARRVAVAPRMNEGEIDDRRCGGEGRC